MNRRNILFAAASGAMAFQAPPAPKTHLKKGDSAPDFKLRATNGATVTLGEFHGKNTVVLAFFPAAFTGG